MKLTEMLSTLRTKLGELASKDKIEKGDLSDLESSLAGIARKAGLVESDLEASNKESADRRITITDLENKIKEKDTKIAELDKRPDPKDSEQTIQTLKDKITGLMKGQRTSFENRFETISKHERFAAMKQFYKLPEPDKDGKYDLTKMSDDDLEHNINKLAEHDLVETFGKVEQPSGEGSTKKDKPGGGTEVKIENEDDFHTAIEKELDKY